MGDQLRRLIAEAQACRLCEAQLPLGPRPVFTARAAATLVLVGQAPGSRVHASGIPWDDASGRTLRAWLDLPSETFYHHPGLAILPSGFCYPGRTARGDAPPRPECAQTWHRRFFAAMPQVQLIVAIGRYAQALYLEAPGATLSDNVTRYAEYLPQGRFPLPHPSPRNRRWVRDRPWFEADVLPALRRAVHGALAACKP